MTAQQQRIGEAFRVRSYYGLGDTTQQGDAATVSSSLYHSAALATAIGGPIAGGIVAAAGAVAQIVSLFGPNPNNQYTTEVVNQVEADGLEPNLKAWQAIPNSQKTVAMQQFAEQTFMQGWNYVLSACNNPALGSSGINCIKDRQRGGKFDWWALYYDPIANDPNPSINAAAAASAATTPSSATGAVDSTVASVSSAIGISPLWIGVGIIAAALLMVGD